MGKTKKALIVVDMLNDFLKKEGSLYCGDRSRKIIPYIKKMISKFRKRGDLVIYTNDTHATGDREFNLFGKHCVKGSIGAQVIPELTPQRKDFIVQKTTYDAAFNSNLVRILKKRHIKETYFVGVCTSICVMETASTLAKLGYKIYIYKNGVSDFDGKAHAFALKRMKFIYGANII